jgi:hypothetical protein
MYTPISIAQSDITMPAIKFSSQTNKTSRHRPNAET